MLICIIKHNTIFCWSIRLAFHPIFPLLKLMIFQTIKDWTLGYSKNTGTNILIQKTFIKYFLVLKFLFISFKRRICNVNNVRICNFLWWNKAENSDQTFLYNVCTRRIGFVTIGLSFLSTVVIWETVIQGVFCFSKVVKIKP